MKNSIKLSVLFFLLSAGIFATSAASAKSHTPKTKDVITVSAMKKNLGVAVNIIKTDEGKSVVRIYDKENHILLKDFLPNKAEASKGYILTNLENGDYTFEVTSNKEVVTKTVHVYDEDQKRTFFFID